MAHDSLNGSDPFADNAAIDGAIEDERETIVESTLAVGRNATLTLGTDSVIVLGWLMCHLILKRYHANGLQL